MTEGRGRIPRGSIRLDNGWLRAGAAAACLAWRPCAWQRAPHFHRHYPHVHPQPNKPTPARPPTPPHLPAAAAEAIVAWMFGSEGVLRLGDESAIALSWEILYNAVNKTCARVQVSPLLPLGNVSAFLFL